VLFLALNIECAELILLYQVKLAQVFKKNTKTSARVGYNNDVQGATGSKVAKYFCKT